MNQNPEVEESNSEELYEHHKVIVDPGQEMIRIDKFLLEKIPGTSRNRIQNAAKSGGILVNEKAVKQNYKVKPGRYHFSDVSISQ